METYEKKSRNGNTYIIEPFKKIDISDEEKSKAGFIRYNLKTGFLERILMKPVPEEVKIARLEAKKQAREKRLAERKVENEKRVQANKLARSKYSDAVQKMRKNVAEQRRVVRKTLSARDAEVLAGLEVDLGALLNKSWRDFL